MINNLKNSVIDENIIDENVINENVINSIDNLNNGIDEYIINNNNNNNNNKRRSLSDLNRNNFKHMSKNNNSNNGIVTTLLGNPDKIIHSGKIKNVSIYIHNNNNHNNCEECQKNNKKKITYFENRDICMIGTRVKLVNPQIIKFNGKDIEVSHKTIIRRCNGDELDLVVNPN